MTTRHLLAIDMTPIGIRETDAVIYSGNIHFCGLTQNEIIYHLEQFVSTLDNDSPDMSIRLVCPTPDNFKREFPSRINSDDKSSVHTASQLQNQ